VAENEHVSCPGRESTEPGGEHYTNIPDVDGEIESVEEVVNNAASRHKPGVDRSTDDTA
jgi:hypothetical protein